MAISSYFAKALSEKILEDTDFTVTVPYISLHSATPGGTGANEITAGSEGGSYSRQPCASWGTGLPRQNQIELVWNNTPFVRITHFGIWDAVSAGNFLWGGPLSVSPITLFLGERARFNQNRLTVNVGRGWSDWLIPKILDKLLKNIDFNVDFVHASIHTGDPGGDGANEVAGGAGRPVLSGAVGSWADPALVTNTWTAEYTASDNRVWSAVADNTYSHIGLWDDASAGNFLWGGALTTPVVATGGSNELSIPTNSKFFARIIQNA